MIHYIIASFLIVSHKINVFFKITYQYCCVLKSKSLLLLILNKKLYKPSYGKDHWIN